jgi:UDP-glucose 4-epimerase
LPERVVVTGAGGFVGANLARRLVAEGHEVTVLLRNRNEAPWRLAEVDLYATSFADIADAARVSAAVRAARPRWVFHLAAYGAYPSQTDWDAMVRTNVTGTANLVRACVEAGVESFVNAGSSSEYGFKDHAPREDEMIEPNSEYAATKAAATLYCAFTARARQVRMRTLRLYSVFGPWEEPSRLIPTLLVAAMQGRLPALADPRVARDFVYVDDVCDAFLAAAEDAASPVDAIFNVGTGIQSTLASVVDTVRAMLDVDAEPRWGSMPNRSWDSTSWVADASKIQSLLGWRPRWSLQAGLRSTVDWLRANPAVLARYRGVALRTNS